MLMKYHVSIKTQDGNRIETWGVCPISNTTKILDGIYNPESKELSLLLDSVTEQYTDYPVQKGKDGKWEIQQRKLEQYYKLRLPEQDIKFFLDNYVSNNFEITPKIEKISNIITEPV